MKPPLPSLAWLVSRRLFQRTPFMAAHWKRRHLPGWRREGENPTPFNETRTLLPLPIGSLSWPPTGRSAKYVVSVVRRVKLLQPFLVRLVPWSCFRVPFMQAACYQWIPHCSAHPLGGGEEPHHLLPGAVCALGAGSNSTSV